MKTILVTLGTRGDINPFLGLGKALRARGHDVAVITSGNFAADVAEAGLELIELFDGETYERMVDLGLSFQTNSSKAWRLANSPKKLATPDQRLLERFLAAPERAYRLIEEHHVPGNTVLLTSEIATYGAGRIAYEKLGITYVTVWHQVAWWQTLLPLLSPGKQGLEDSLKNALLSTLWLTREIKRRYRALRASLGLPRDTNPVRSLFYGQQLNICLFPRWYVSPWYKDGRAANTVFTDFPRYESGQDRPLAREIEEFLAAGEPPVVFVNTSWQSDLDDFFNASVAACEALGVRGLILTQRARYRMKQSPLVMSAEFAPFKLLLPRVRALVHHGGLGTVATALASGVPQMVIPEGADQPYNAGYVKRLNAGITLPRKRYVRNAEKVLRQLLASEEIRGTCRTIAARFSAEPNFNQAIDRMEFMLAVSRDEQPFHPAATETALG